MLVAARPTSDRTRARDDLPPRRRGALHGVHACLALKEGYSEGRSDAPVLTELAEVEVLAIDELGKGRLSDWELTIIDEVVSRRYNAMGCTLATTNYVPGNPTGAAPPNLSTTQTSTLRDCVGDRVYSRLLQLVDFVEAAGRDYRGPAVH